MVNSELYTVLFNISKKDLATSKRLYENEHYPQSLSFSQGLVFGDF